MVYFIRSVFLFFFVSQLVTLVTAHPISTKEMDKEKEILENLLTELYETAGIYHSDIGKPSLSLSDQSNLKIAAYLPKENQILISTKVIVFGQSKSKSTKINIYLSVLGHELGHYFQRVNTINNGNGSNLSLCHRDSVAEVNADFYSVFTSMLAGHNIIKNEVDEIIGSLYDLFDLKDELHCYPTKSFRQSVADRAIQKADSLYQLFQFANYLTAAEEYRSAIEIYDYLLMFYKGAEFYNNRGILHFLNGVKENYGVDGRYKRYFYPIEMDLNSKLEHVRNDGIFLNNLDKTYFEKAQLDFRKASACSNGNEKYHLNEACCLVLQGKDSIAIEMMEKKCYSDGDTEFMLRAIIKARSGEQLVAEAVSDFEELRDNPVSVMNDLAHVNLTVINSTKFSDSINKNTIKDVFVDLSTYPNWLELRDIPTFSISKKSDYQFGWTYLQDKGKCFVLKKDTSIILDVQESLANFQNFLLSDYLPSSMGLNFQSYEVSNDNKAFQLIILENNKHVILRYR